MTTSSVEQNITIVQRLCKAGNEGLSGDRGYKHQAASRDKLAKIVAGRQRVARRQCNNLFAPASEKRINITTSGGTSPQLATGSG
jgi:hypothetical protein